jgi:hypothetical protein
VVYLVLSLAGFSMAWNGMTIARIVFPVIGVGLTVFALYASVYPVPPSPAKWMPYTLIVCVGLGVIVGLVARFRRVPAMLSVEAQVKPEVV